MKKAIQLFQIIVCLFIQTNLFAQNFWVPDAGFRTFLKQNYPSCFTPQDSMITTCPDLQNVSYLFIDSAGIQDINGLQFFHNLTGLDLWNNNVNYIDSLPHQLNHFRCYYSTISGVGQYPDSMDLVGFGFTPNIDFSNLPQMVNKLQLQNCPGISIPNLPSNLKTLSVHDCPGMTLAPLPASITILNLTKSNLTVLPHLPPNLTYLYCIDNLLTSIDSVPNSVRHLICKNNLLTAVHHLPDSLISFDASFNTRLKSLPPFPDKLNDLDVRNDSLSSLPAFNSELYRLNCSRNFLTVIPAFTNKLWVVNCSHNLLTSLPILDSILGLFDCSYNNLSALPSLPMHLADLTCNNNPISCLPLLPASLASLEISNTYITCMPNFLPVLPNFLPLCSPQFQACDYDVTHGFVFIDTNGNGIMDAGENGYGLAVSSSNGLITQANPSGFFSLFSDSGNTSFQIQLPQYFTNTTPLSQTINVLHNQIDTLYFGIQPIPNINDLKVQVNNVTFLRPGFGAHYTIQYQNVGTSTITNAKVKFLKPLQLFNLSAVPPATSSSGDTLIWNIPSISPFLNPFTIDVWDSVAVTAALGSFADAQAWIEPIAGDTIPANNYVLNSTIIRGSFDPNDKAVSPQFIDENFSDYLDYKIRFQNTGTDTAFNILVTDTLSPLLDWSSIQAIAATGNYQFDLQNGVAKWYFNHILLPDSNVNEVASHGFIEFRIKPVSTVLAGNQIQNKANIYFDFNSPVITNIALVDVTPLAVKQQSFTKSHSYPNPVQTSIYLKSNENKALGKVELLEGSGKHIATKIIATKSFEWNVEALPNGIYILKGENWIEKFVKK